MWGRWIFSRFDTVQEKLNLLTEHVARIKRENSELQRKVYSLETNLKQALAAPKEKMLKEKFSTLAEERDGLMMERELIRNKIKSLIKKLESHAKKDGGEK